MAGMNSVNGYNSLNNVRGFGGLASGLDRDSLIEQMLFGTTSKISKQRQKKTALQWQQDALRNITDKMIAFADKYTATMTSSTNLFSKALWGRNDVSVKGEYSKYVSVSGTSNTANDMAILGVKQLAEKAKLTSGQAASDQTLRTGDIDLDPNAMFDTQKLEGKTLQFKLGSESYTITLKAAKDEDTADGKVDLEAVKASIEEALKAQQTKGGKTLADEVAVTITDDGKFSFSSKIGNGVELKGGSAQKLLGFTDEDIKEKRLTASEAVTGESLVEQQNFLQRIAGKSMSFTYNGVTKAVQFPTADEMQELQGSNDMEKIASHLQSQLDSAFGTGRIKVEAGAGAKDGTYHLQFKTMKNENGQQVEDRSSILSVSSASGGLLGDRGALGISAGESNRVNLNAKISESGLAGNIQFDSDGKAALQINGESIEVTSDMTVNDLMNTINGNAKLGVTISYQSMSDSFTITSKQEGASGKVELDDSTAAFFGIAADKKSAEGQDAIVAVRYGDAGEIELNRSSNTFDLDGMKVSVSGTFGYVHKKDTDGKELEELELDKTSEAVTFDAKVDSGKIVDAVKKMIEEYNEIVELVNKEVSTKPDRGYAPLTDEQKKELSEDEIKTYEEKAKQGLLFGDSDLRNLSRDLRYVISSVDQEALRAIGISTSSSYADNGKLEFDEAKFKKALETDPQKVEELFTKQGGIANNMKAVGDKYAKTMGATKGILVEKAGSTKSPLSITNNGIYKEMQAIDKLIAQLEARKKSEEDRYIKQFTSLETLISQMNSQSSMFSQFGGY